MRDLIKATKALSDETRLRILNLLLQRECCVCEIMQAMDISQSRASRNLGILRAAGFIKAQRSGAFVLYSLDRNTSNRYAGYLARLLKDFPVSDETTTCDSERLKTAKRTGPGCDRKQGKHE